MDIFKGLSAFPITPADAAGRVDTDALSEILTRIMAAKVASIGLLGSTGTYVYLTRAERKRAVHAAAQTIDGHTPLIVGVGALRTSDAVALAEDAQQAGANGLLLAPVSYAPLTSDEVFTHFQTVASATDLPICVYNNPGTTHFNFDLPLLQRLAAQPKINAIKMPLPASRTVAADLAQLRATLPADFMIGYSADWGSAEALGAGADAFYSGLAGVLPAAMQDLAQAAMSGDAQATAHKDEAFALLWPEVKAHGGMRVSYTIARHLGLTDAVPPAPVQLPPKDAEARIIAALAGLNLS